MPAELTVWSARLAAVALAITAGPEATGVPGADAVFRAALGLALVVAAGLAPRGVLLAAAAATCATGSTLGVVAAAAAVVHCLPARPRAETAAVTGAALAGAVLRLAWPATERATAVVAGAVVLAVAGSALVRVPAPRRRLLVAVGGGAVVGATTMALLYAVTLAGERAHVQDAVARIETSLAAARDGRTADAATILRQAAVDLDAVEARLDRWWALPGRVVPLVGHQATAVDALLGGAGDLAVVAANAASVADEDELLPRGGRVDLALVDRLRGSLEDVASSITRLDAVARDVRSPWLAPALSRELTRLVDRTDEAALEVERALGSAHVVPALLGGNGPRTWFLALLTSSELRGGGGFPGNYGILRADDGELELEHVGRIAEILDAVWSTNAPLLGDTEYLARYASTYKLDRYFQNVTASPHFPSVGSAVSQRVGLALGRPIDGVIALDPYAFATILEVTGPVVVPDWPEPLTPANAARILLHDQYVALDIDSRARLLEDATRALFAQLTDGPLPPPRELASVLGRAVDGKHLQLWSSHPSEQAWFESIGAAGALPPVHGDALAVLVNNANENKIDWFLRRSVSYEARVDPVTGEVDAVLEVTLMNDAPAAGLPAYVIGPMGPTSPPAGHNRMLVSVLTPLGVDAATVDGEPVVVTSGSERRRHAYDLFLTIPPGGSSVVRLELSGEVDVDGGVYRLDLTQQPGVRDDTVEIDVRGGSGWRAVGGRSTFVPIGDQTLQVLFERA